jgi:hypothetical protein
MFGVAAPFENWPASLHWSLHIGSMSLMALLIFFPNKKAAGLLFILVLFQCMADQDRWQPWEYQYLFSLGVYLFFRQKEQQFAGWQFLLVCIYFFSGFHKLSPDFIYAVWNRFFLGYVAGIWDVGPWLSRVGYFIPVIELSAGLALLFNKTRQAAVYFLLAMHLFIIAMYWPLGWGTSLLLLPWNAVMIGFLLAAFHKEHLFLSIAWAKRPFAWVMIGLVGIMPFFHRWDKWDGNLSMAMYSRGGPTMYICTQSTKAKKDLSSYFIKGHPQTGCDSVLYVNAWSGDNKGTALTLEKRMTRRMMKYFQGKYADSLARFYLYKPGFGARITRIYPGD